MASTPRVNYNNIAPNYDQRTEGGYLEGINSALQALARQVQARHILDVGCGTGRSLRGLADSLQPKPVCYGLDFSGGMLIQAQQFDSTYRLVNATAPLPPFAANSFDLIFCVHAFHHFPDKLQVVRNAFRMLRNGGVFAIINFDPHQCQDWYVYEFFDTVLATDLRRFSPVTDKENLLRQVGFQQIQSPMVEHISEKLIGEAVFDNYFLKKDSCSQLILLSDETYQIGLDRMRAAISEATTRGEAVIFSTEIKNWMTYGTKQVMP